jgi:hypothetical protein
MYGSCIQNFFINVDTSTTHQITTAPTMKQAEEVMSPIRTAITRSRGPLFKFLTEGSLQNTTGSRAHRVKLASTKKGIENFLTGSIIEVRPMSIDKLQGLRPKVSTIDEWLSGDIREDVVGAIEQGASKLDDYLVLKSERIKFSVVGTIDYKEPWILESISKLKLKSIELEIKASKQNVPEKYLIKKIHEADLVFAPYAHLTESGTASLAISQFIPVFFVGESAPFSLRLDVFRGFVVVAAKNSDINSIFYHTLIRTYQKLPYETVIHLEAQYILAFDQIMDKIDPNC